MHNVYSQRYKHITYMLLQFVLFCFLLMIPKFIFEPVVLFMPAVFCNTHIRSELFSYIHWHFIVARYSFDIDFSGIWQIIHPYERLKPREAAKKKKKKKQQDLCMLLISLLFFFFQNKIILDPMTFSEARFRPSLEERLESIISGAALMADSSCTRDDRRERIVAECNAVRQALQDLLSEYMNNVSYTNLVLASFLQMFKFSVYNILALIIKKKKKKILLSYGE